jgi:hypothetical protein
VPLHEQPGLQIDTAHGRHLDIWANSSPPFRAFRKSIAQSTASASRPRLKPQTVRCPLSCSTA